MRRYIFKIICYSLLMFTLISPVSKPSASDNYNILILTSYSSGNKFFDNQLHGIQESLSSKLDKEYKLYIEHMDTSNQDMSINHSKFYDSLKLKSSLYKDLDAIIVCDDTTLDFVISKKTEFSSEVSKFFLGVHDQTLINSAIDYGFVGGIEEFVSIKETIKSIDKLFKGNKDLVFMLPQSDIYEDELAEFYSVSNEYTNFNFTHMYIPYTSDKQFLSDVKSLNVQDTIVLFLPPYKDLPNSFSVNANTCYTIFNILTVPIFNLVDYSEVNCSLGGKVVNSYNQGLKLGELIYSNLKFNIEPTFIDHESANKWIFKYENLKKHGIKKSKFPEFVEVLGTPVPLHKQPLDSILPLIVLITFLLFIIGGLSVHTLKKHKYEKELYKAKKHAEDMNLAKNNFISNISHELRTPVAVITSSSQLLRRLVSKNSDGCLESINHNFDVIEQNSNRLLRLINNIIDIAKTDSKIIDLNLQNTDIVSLVEDTVLSIVPYAQIKNINVVFDTYVEELTIAVDIEKIERVLLNLLSNAIKFSNYNGSIYAKVSSDAYKAIITIKDTGIGIDSKHLSYIFKKFAQVDNGFTRNNEGSGIGLSIVKSFVQLHKGSVFVDSTKNEGTIFTILLPISTVSNDNNPYFLSSDKNVDIELSDIYFDRYENN